MKNNSKERLDVVFILDNSGSMGGSEENTITSYNEYLERERKKKYNVNITTVLFNDQYKYLSEWSIYYWNYILFHIL